REWLDPALARRGRESPDVLPAERLPERRRELQPRPPRPERDVLLAQRARAAAGAHREPPGRSHLQLERVGGVGSGARLEALLPCRERDEPLEPGAAGEGRPDGPAAAADVSPRGPLLDRRPEAGARIVGP